MSDGDGQKRCESVGPTGRCKNWAIGGDWCRLHDPELAERRQSWGRQRKVRFSTGIRIDGVPVDRTTVPTTARVVDALLDVADDVRRGDLEPKEATAITAALRAALDGLWKERDAATKALLAESGSRLMPSKSEATEPPGLEDELSH